MAVRIILFTVELILIGYSASRLARVSKRLLLKFITTLCVFAFLGVNFAGMVERRDHRGVIEITYQMPTEPNSWLAQLQGLTISIMWALILWTPRVIWPKR